eukprot:3114538-Alexandrium_andersonii.AAC.1
MAEPQAKRSRTLSRLGTHGATSKIALSRILRTLYDEGYLSSELLGIGAGAGSISSSASAQQCARTTRSHVQQA